MTAINQLIPIRIFNCELRIANCELRIVWSYLVVHDLA